METCVRFSCFKIKDQKMKFPLNILSRVKYSASLNVTVVPYLSCLNIVRYCWVGWLILWKAAYEIFNQKNKTKSRSFGFLILKLQTPCTYANTLWIITIFILKSFEWICCSNFKNWKAGKGLSIFLAKPYFYYDEYFFTEQFLLNT